MSLEQSKKGDKVSGLIGSTTTCNIILGRIKQAHASDAMEFRAKIMAKLGETTGIPVAVTKLKEPSDDSISEIFGKMSCLNCGRLPSPYKRFLCSDGHIFCGKCGEDRFVKHGAKCLIEIEDAPDQKDEGARGSSSATPHQWNEWMLGENAFHFPLCQKMLKSYAPDPIFTSVWMNATWKCPFCADGCNEMVKGRELSAHAAVCSARKSKTERDCPEICTTSSVESPAMTESCSESPTTSESSSESAEMSDSTSESLATSESPSESPAMSGSTSESPTKSESANESSTTLESTRESPAMSESAGKFPAELEDARDKSKSVNVRQRRKATINGVHCKTA